MFSKKKLKVVISKYTTTINADGKRVVNFASGEDYTFDDYKISCKIEKVPSTCGYTASIDIFGVSQTSLDGITNIVWLNSEIAPMGVRIYADEGDGYYTLFEGGVMMAVPNYRNVPDVSIHIESSMMVYPNLMKPPPVTLEPGTIISDFCKKLCSQYEYGCDTDVGLSLRQFHSEKSKVFNQDSFGERVKELCRICDITFSLKYGNVYFYDKGLSLPTVWEFTSENYNGYPSFEKYGISIMLDSATMPVNCGEIFRVKNSVINPANGSWSIYAIKYNLETWKENGKWEMVLYGTRIIENG